LAVEIVFAILPPLNLSSPHPRPSNEKNGIEHSVHYSRPTPVMPIATDARTTSRPSRTRHLILLFAMTLAVITYIDRVCISQAAGDIQRDLGLTKVQMGWAFAAFAWAYALFEIPGGWLGDKISCRCC